MTETQHFAKKPDLVFLHGWGMNTEVWATMRKLFHDHFQVHCVDLPGHGCHAGQKARDDVLDWTDQIAAVTPPRAIYIAWSLGGMIALQLAHRYPEKVTQLILIGCSPKFLQASDWPRGMPASVLNEFILLLQRDDKQAIKEFLLLQVVESVGYAATLKQLRAVLAAAPRPLKSALQEGLDILRDQDLREELRSLQCPLFSIYGQHDRLVSRELEPEISRIQPAMRSLVMAESGHAPFLSHTQQTEAAIKAFINSNQE